MEANEFLIAMTRVISTSTASNVMIFIQREHNTFLNSFTYYQSPFCYTIFVFLYNV